MSNLKKDFTNYQLYRTTPKLSGNMQYDLILDKVGNELQVIDFHIRPISPNIVYNVKVEENLLIRPHQFNISNFYKQIKSNFYNTCINPQLDSDWPILLNQNIADAERKYVKSWDDTYWSGTQRMSYSLYGKTHESLVPLWLERVASSIYIKINMDTDSGISLHSLYLKLERPIKKFNKTLSPHEKFCEYLFNYFDYIQMTEGNDDCISLNFDKNIATIRGLNVENGTIIVRQDYNMVKNMLYRERPMIETDSIITNIYKDTNLILPQLINFNLVYNPAGWIGGLSSLVSNKPNCQISIDIFVDGESLEKRDIYTNYYFIPRPYISAEGSDTSDELLWSKSQDVNALDYLKDNTISDMMHVNKIVQPICHWVVSSDPKSIFNLYDGFGSYSYDENGNMIFQNHTMGGQSIGTNNEQYWTGAMRRGNGADVEEILNNPNKYIDDIKYLKSMSGYINGNKFSFTPTGDIKDIYVGTMSTYRSEETDSDRPSHTYKSLSEINTTAIWLERFDYNTNNSYYGYSTLPEFGSNRSSTNSYPDQKSYNYYSYNDITYDVARHHDMDNRYGQYIYNLTPERVGAGGWTDTYRRLKNCYGLYISMREFYRPNKKTGEQQKCLAVIFWAQEVNKRRSGSTTDGIIYRNWNSPLSLSTINSALTDYVSYYGQYVNNFPKLDREIFDNLKQLNTVVQNISIPQVIYFYNSVIPLQDNSVSKDSKENTYYKVSNANSYVYRYSESIKPAIFTPACQRIGGILHYSNQFGRNYLWLKDILKQDEIISTQEYKKYIYKNIPPKYPSIGYDSVHLYTQSSIKNVYDEKINKNITKSNELYNPKGDLIYNEPLSIFNGQDWNNNTPSNTDLYGPWIEYKWFNKSRITILKTEDDNKIISVYHNDKETIEQEAYNMLSKLLCSKPFVLNGKSYDHIDMEYIKKLYNISYNLIGISLEKPKDKQYAILDENAILYTYRVKYKLK